MTNRTLTGLCLALVVLLSACALEIDLKQQSRFEAFDDGRFRYESYADAAWPESSERAESARIKVLEETLATNRLCTDGFELSERKAFLKQKGFAGDVYDLVYYGRCT